MAVSKSFPLARISERKEKADPKQYKGTPFLGLDDIEPHTMKLVGVKDSGDLRSSAKKFYKGDVLYSRLRPYLNKVWVADRDGLCSSEFIVLNQPEVIYPKFLAYRLNSSDFVAFANSLDAGDRPRVNYKQISDFEIPAYDLERQREIVNSIEGIFSELDSGIASLKTAQQQLGIYRQSLLKHAFEGKLTEQWRKDNASKLETPEQLLTRIQQERKARYQQQLEEWQQAVKEWGAKGKEGKKPTKPKKASAVSLPIKSDVQDLPITAQGWALFSLDAFISQITAGKSFKCEEREPNLGEVGVAKVSAVTWGEYDESESKTCTDPEKINPDYFIKAGDFIFSRANTIELVGACVIAKKVTKQIMLSDKTLKIDFIGINKSFVLHYLRSHLGRKEIMERSTGNQESMRNIGQARIRSIVIPICSLAEQQEIINQLEEKLSIVEQNEKEIETALTKAELLRQSILKKAFSGQLIIKK